MPFRPKYADVAATVALVLSMGGTAYAATVIYSSNIADNTIQSRDVRDDNLLSRDVRNGTLTSADVLNGSLSGADVKDGSLGLADINDTAEQALKGQQGVPGPQGDKGDVGTAGSPGVSGYYVLQGPETFGAVNDVVTAFAVCPAGKKPLAGGWLSGANNLPLDVKESHPRTLAPGEVEAFPEGGEAWQVSAREVWSTGGSTANWYLRAWVTCAYVS